MRRAFDDLSGKVIAAAIEVHRRLGPGFLEGIYEQALRIELASRHLPFVAQKEILVKYGDQVVGRHVLDVLVGEGLVVELKAVSRLEQVHLAQVKSYLRAVGVTVGLLLNFAGTTLDVRRVVLHYEESESASV